MADLGDSTWSEVDASNNATPPNGWPEGMFPSDVNNAARAQMGGEKRWWARSNSTMTTAGTSTAYTLTYAQAASAYYTGEEFSFVVNQTCGAAPSLNINGLGAQFIRKFAGGSFVTLAAGDIVANQPVRVRTNGVFFDIIVAAEFIATGDFFAVNTLGYSITSLGAVFPFDSVASGNSGSWFSTITNRYTPPAGRFHLFCSSSVFNSVGSPGSVVLSLRKNGSVLIASNFTTTAGIVASGTVEGNYDANGTTDFFDMFVSTGAGQGTVTGTQAWFGAFQVA